MGSKPRDSVTTPTDPQAVDGAARGPSAPRVAALFVAKNGPYLGRAGVDAWTKDRDARLYDGGLPVVTHPPCERWGMFARGSPTAQKYEIGDDGGCFKAALAAVRRCGGVIEHPRGSHAWRHFGLPRPPSKGWSHPDAHGGRSCYIDQGVYGHPAKKPTWLYAVLPAFPELDWTRVWGRPRISGSGSYRTRRARMKAKASSKGVRTFPEVSRSARYLTPALFADLLVGLAESCSSAPILVRAPKQAVLA